MNARNLETAKRLVFGMEHPDEYTFTPEDVERAARFTLEETEGGWLFVDEDGTARVLVPPHMS